MNTFRWWFSQGCCCYCHQVASVVSRFVRSHRQQPTRLLCAWDSPGKNTGVSCHFLLCEFNAEGVNAEFLLSNLNVNRIIGADLIDTLKSPCLDPFSFGSSKAVSEFPIWVWLKQLPSHFDTFIKGGKRNWGKSSLLNPCFLFNLQSYLIWLIN